MVASLVMKCPQLGNGTTPLSGEIGGGLKKTTVLGMMCLCRTVQQSQWSRRNNLSRIRRVPQEAKAERAIFVFIVTSLSVIAVACVRRRLVVDEELCSKD